MRELIRIFRGGAKTHITSMHRARIRNEITYQGSFEMKSLYRVVFEWL